MRLNIQSRRKLDFYIRGLSPEIRQKLHRKLDQISPISIKHLLEKPEGYPSFRRMQLTEEEQKLYIQNLKALFDDVNAFLTAHSRCPLFSNTEDSCQTAAEYREIMTSKPLPELEEEFGCSFQDYVPPAYTGDGAGGP